MSQNKMYRYKLSFIQSNNEVKVEKKDFPHGISSYPKQWLYGKLMSLGFSAIDCQNIAYKLACQCLPGNQLTNTYQTLFENTTVKIEARQV